MALIPAQCSNCGGKIEIDDTKEKGICKYCNLEYITETVINNHINNFNIVNNITKIVNGEEKDDTEEIFQKGLSYIQTKDFENAKKSFEKCIEINPTTSKFYFYWCLAESKNFVEPKVFLGYESLINKPETSKKIISFFTLTNEQECQSLTIAYGVNFNDGYDGLVLSIFQKYLKELQDNSLFNYVLLDTLELLNKDSDTFKYVLDICKKYVSDLASKYYEDVRKNNNTNSVPKYERDKIVSIIRYMLNNKLYPNCNDTTVDYVDSIKLAYFLNEENKVNNTKQEYINNRDDRLIKDCASLEESLYFLKARNIFTVIIFTALFTGVGYCLGWVMYNWFGWIETKGFNITVIIFFVMGVIYSLSGYILKKNQDKLKRQIIDQDKLKDSLAKARDNSSKFFRETISNSSSSGVFKSTYLSSDTSSNESNTTNNSSNIYDSSGKLVGSMENKGSGRINNIYDEYGNNIGWSNDTGGDILDVHYNDGSTGTINKKK